MNNLFVLNINDKEYTKRVYHVMIGVFKSFEGIVYADCEQDAIDSIIDYWQETEEKTPGYFLSEKEIQGEKYLDDYIYGGNNCRYLSFPYHELRIIDMDKEL